jgi:hypothetical protein
MQYDYHITMSKQQFLKWGLNYYTKKGEKEIQL